MSVNVETMFYVGRKAPWHGLGQSVAEAPTSKDALGLAGLDWRVIQVPITTEDGMEIAGYKANLRNTDFSVLGVVTDRYKVVQNDEAFAFIDALLGQGVRFETAGSLQEGRKVWMLARLPREYVIAGETISPYLVFSNTHDGSGAVKVAITPIRVLCNNTLNLALETAERSFSMVHTGDIDSKLEEAKNVLFKADKYMQELGKEFDRLRNVELTDDQFEEYLEMLLPVDKDASIQQYKNVKKQREDIRRRYHFAPDLVDLKKSAYRFINAVSDFATHATPLRRTEKYRENMFNRTVEGNPLIDRAYKLVCAA